MKLFENGNGCWVNIDEICTATEQGGLNDKSIILRMSNDREVQVSGVKYTELMHIFKNLNNTYR